MVKQYKWKQIGPNIWKEVPPSECHECGHDEFSRILTKLLRSSIPKTKSYRVTEECTKCGLKEDDVYMNDDEFDEFLEEEDNLDIEL